MPQPKAEDVKRLFATEFDAFKEHLSRTEGTLEEEMAAILALEAMDRRQLNMMIDWTMHPLSGFLPQYSSVKPLPLELGSIFLDGAFEAFGNRKIDHKETLERSLFAASSLLEEFYNQKIGQNNSPAGPGSQVESVNSTIAYSHKSPSSEY